MAPLKLVNFRLDVEQLAALQAIKDREGIPLTTQVRMALRAWIDLKGRDQKTARTRAATRTRA